MSDFFYVPCPKENMAWYVHQSSIPYWKNYLMTRNWIEHNKCSMVRAQQSILKDDCLSCPSLFQPRCDCFSNCFHNKNCFSDRYWQDYYSTFRRCFMHSCNANSFGHCNGCNADQEPSENFDVSENNLVDYSIKSQDEKKSSFKFKKSFNKKKKKRSRRQSASNSSEVTLEFNIEYMFTDHYLKMKEIHDKHVKEREALKKAAEEEATLEKLSSYMNKLTTYEDFKVEMDIKQYFYGEKANIIANLESTMKLKCIKFCDEHNPDEWPLPL